MTRVTTYLNFTNNTEEAFLFYQSIFGGEFTRGGIVRFGDIPPSEGMPPLAEADKNLIMHIELPIAGGHVLMGTDAPESMGFKVNFGNNVHINIEPDTKEETKMLFDKLSAGGKITMDLQDMFWGSYYGSCTDKFGVQWMFNCTERKPGDKRMITVQTTVNAPLDEVWDKWTSPSDITKWNHASDDWHSPRAENDLRVGGKFSYRMEAKDGSMGFDFEGTYDTVKKNELIEYKIIDGRKVTVSFFDERGKTKVVESFEVENKNPEDKQKFGWQSILDNFKKHVES